ncbi:NYN domain-containing protein [Actinoallomurus spadix]|uniref:NYN domain-containing protein n=1 Tax=Actinoallomurus spadix TaxID=79912 RepID=A0ABP3FQN3_9ACTN|nr:NYN domain-containing protein [Actinoallomurus spadix]MCO5985331.1 NYN domain-containing protein [Actinoallomurus spadix]
MRANVYVDGFNLYYGCLKGARHKWLDLDALSRRLLPQHEHIHRIRYFTAQIGRRTDDPQRHNRQQIYLRALRTIPHLEIHLGRFQQTTVRMPLAVPPVQGPRTVEVIKTEEKGSDVNLATYLVADAFRGDFDAALVITNDADLAEPIRLVCHELRLVVGIASPHPPHRRSGALRQATPTFFRQIRPSTLRACQFPDLIKDGQGLVQGPLMW